MTVTSPGGVHVDVGRTSGPSAQPNRTIALVGVLVVVGTAIRCVLAATTDGTNDVDTWLAFIEASGSVGPLDLYSVQSWPTVPSFDFNHGPLVAYSMPLADAAVGAGVDGRFLVRLPAIVADAATAVMVFGLARRRYGDREGLLAAAAIALNPVLILVSGFHGNTDPVFVALLVATLVLFDRDRPGAAGVATALALGVKIVPVVVAPFLVLGLPTSRDRLRFVGAGALTSVVVWAPVLSAGAGDVIREVFLYPGLATRWGLGRLFWGELSLDPDGPFRRLWTIALFAALWAVAWRLRRAEPRPVDWSIGVGFLIFLAASPAFGAQYLAWPVPFLALVGFRVSTAYALAAGAHIYLRYAWWSGGGLTLGHANSWVAPASPVSVRLSDLVVWLVMVAIVFVELRRRACPGPRTPSARGGSPSGVPRRFP